MNFVYVDDSRNLLHLIYVGMLDKTSAGQLRNAVMAVSARFRDGFDILADLRDVKGVEKEAVSIIDELMELLDKRGVRRVVRILPEDTENFGFGIMSIIHYSHDVRFVTCLNLEEAMAALSITSESTDDTPGGIRQPAGGSPKPVA